MSTQDDKTPGDKIGNDAKNMADEAKKAASNFTEEAKQAGNEFKEEARNAFNNVKEEWNQPRKSGDNNKVIAGVMGILFGYLGIHKFILGYNKEGFIQLAISLVTCGVGGIIGFIEGIIYLTKSDEEFYQTYVVNKKGWF